MSYSRDWGFYSVPSYLWKYLGVLMTLICPSPGQS
jgi:hypothetical protein